MTFSKNINVSKQECHSSASQEKKTEKRTAFIGVFQKILNGYKISLSIVNVNWTECMTTTILSQNQDTLLYIVVYHN